MQYLTRFLLFAALLACPMGARAAAPPVPLGSPDFRPTPERPFGWRGDGSGRFPGAIPVTEWSPTNHVRWSAIIGRSYSSPVLTEKFVIATSEPNLLLCLRRKDGAVEWKLEMTPALLGEPNLRKKAESYELPKDGSGMTAATPITDGQNVYVILANGIVCAVDLTGKLKWAACIGADPTTSYGRSASPLIVAGRLIVHMSHLYAFDLDSGKQLWVNAEAKSSYGTPVALKVGKAEVIVTSLGEVVRADNGTSVNSGIAHTAHSSPIVCGEGMVCFGDSSVSAMRLNPTFKEEEAWSGTVEGEVFGSPLWHARTVFISTGEGDLFAFDANGQGTQEPLNGRQKLFERNEPGGPVAYSSLTLAGPYLFLTTNDGETAVLDATPQAKLIQRNKLARGTGSSPVFSGSEMFLRDGDRLFCIGQ